MTNPVDLILDPVSLAIFGLYAGLWLFETLRPGRRLERLKGSTARGLLAFTAFFFASSYLPILWDGHLARYQFFDLRHLSPLLGGLVALFAYELAAYVYHRALHSSNFLFRYVHQTHHSSERLDIPSAFYFHPLDMVGWSLVTSFGLVLFVGVSSAATTVALLTLNFLGLFQHSNIKTPTWLGYFVQRPESHSVHHARGHHRSNYADLPIFDIVFGTFENPQEFAHATGYYSGASARVWGLLRGEDVAAGDQKRAEAQIDPAQSIAVRTLEFGESLVD